MPGPKIPRPKIDANMSLLMIGLLLLVIGNIYYTFRQYNELNQRIKGLNNKRVTDDGIPNVETFDDKEVKSNSCPPNCVPNSCNPLKKLFVNQPSEKVSENIQQEIKIVDTEEVKNDVNDVNEEINSKLQLEEVDINFKELDAELSNVAIGNNENYDVLNSKSKKELMDIAEENSLSKSGTKNELINRLISSNVEIE